MEREKDTDQSWNLRRPGQTVRLEGLDPGRGTRHSLLGSSPPPEDGSVVRHSVSDKVRGARHSLPIQFTVVRKLISIGTAFLFIWSMVIPSATAETITLEGGTVEVNVRDHITNVGVTGNPVWNLPEFNVAQGSTYNLTGLSAGASLAMLVNGGQASNIFGTLNLRDLAFILQNIAGINIGSAGLINLSNASFIASTIPMNLSMTNFLARQFEFSGQGGFLSNEGRILGGKGDLVALISNAIENKGTIEVPMGTVVLAAGKTVTIGLSGDGLISVGVDEATANAMGLKDQIKNTGTIQANGGRVILDAKAVDGLFEKAIHIQRSDKAVTAIQADDGTIEFKSMDDIYNDAVIQAMQGEIKMTSTAGAITNTGSMDASKGRIEMSAKGDIETTGNLEVAYFREKAAAFRIGGDYHVGQSFHDNLDNAITYSANTNVSGTISDVANILINAGVTLTLTDDTIFNTDSDTNGTGAFLMDAAATILGGGKNLSIIASGNSTFGKISNVGNLTLNAQDAEVSYQVRNIVTMTGNLIVNTGATLTGGYSITVGGGSVTGNGIINMHGGTFTLTGSGSFGGTSDWTFENLVFGDGTAQTVTSKTGPNKVTVLSELKISNNHQLKAGSSTWNLSWGGGYLADVIQIAAGYEHSLALLSNGTVMAWGSNLAHQLGDGTDISYSAIPILVPDVFNVIQIAAGSYHSLALLSDTTVKAWGSNWLGEIGNGTSTPNGWGGQPTPVSVYADATQTDLLTGVVQIAAGNSLSLALMADTTVKSWGNNNRGQLGDGTTTSSFTPVTVMDPSDPSGKLSGVTQITAGDDFALALMADTTVKAWGSNKYGTLGNGESGNGVKSTTPISVYADAGKTSFLTGVIQIAAGFQHVLVLMSGGTVKAWGDNGSNQLGYIGAKSTTPVDVAGLSDVTEIAGGGFHSLALLSDHTIRAWGANWYGQLGDGETSDNPTPAPVYADGTKTDYLTGVLQIAGGGEYSLGLTTDGRVRGWGGNYSGQIGNNSSGWEGVLAPTNAVAAGGSVTTLTDISKIVGGFLHTLALRSDGSRVYSWGYNDFGQLGNGTAGTALTPTEVLNTAGDGYLVNVSDVFAGGMHSLALLNDGTVMAWGLNTSGQLGDGTRESSPLPVHVYADAGMTDYLSGVTQLAAGDDYTLALLSDTTVRTWGNNTLGQLGDGTTTRSLTPVRVYADADKDSYLTGVTQIAAGADHSLALMSDTTVRVWGSNEYGQLGDGNGGNPGDKSTTPVKVYADAGKASYLTNVTQIAAGGFHSLALMSDTTVRAWGSNRFGQLGDGNGGNFGDISTTPVSVYSNPETETLLTGVTGIAAGYYHSVARFSDQSVVSTWGLNDCGQLGNGTGDTEDSMSLTPTNAETDPDWIGTTVTQIAAGGYHTLALLSGHTVKSWGDNAYGQLGINSVEDALTPQETQVLSRAPFVIDWDPENPKDAFDAQESTFQYTGDFAFGGLVSVTVIADTIYNKLILSGELLNYIDVTLLPPTLKDLEKKARGGFEILGEDKPVPEIDTTAVRKAIKKNEAKTADGVLARNPLSPFLDPAQAMKFITDVWVLEGAVVVYPLDGGSDASLLTQGESLSVPFKEKKTELERPGQKGPEEKPVLPALEPAMITGGNQPEVSHGEEPLLGTYKPATPVVAGHDEGAGRYGTLKNPGKDVFVKCQGGDWQAAKDGMVIMPGDVVKTAAAGSVEVMLDGGKVGRVEIKEGSLFRINKADTNPASGDKTTLLELAIGKLIAHVEKLQGKSKFEVRSPTALTGVRGTVFEVVVKEKTP